MAFEDQFGTLGQMLCNAAQTHPAVTAFVRLRDGETPEPPWTPRVLHLRAGAVAAHLSERGLRGRTALLLYPQGLDFTAAFFGCLYAGVTAAPVSAPETHLRRSLARIADVVEDADPGVILTTGAMGAACKPLVAGLPGFAGREWLVTDDGLEADFVPVDAGSEDIAYLQYTSGSTSTPKGVIMTHRNVFAELDLLNAAYAPRAGEAMVSWLPQFHDLGLVYGMVWPVANQLPCFVMSPAEFVRRPLRWLRAMSDHRGVYSGGPNFAYDLCVRKISDAERDTLDLSCWKVALNGAEPVRADTLHAFAQRFARCGFKRSAVSPAYGLAEATLVVTTTPHGAEYRTLPVRRAALELEHRVEPAGADAAGVRELVTAGRLYDQAAVCVVDPETHAARGEREIGEVWIRGEMVSPGYLNKPDATEETFCARIRGGGELSWLRTGDLGFLHDGDLFITGRRKDLIIIRGENHYPQDIEHTASNAHVALRPGCASAFSVDVADEEQLVVVCELRDEANAELHQSSDESRVLKCGEIFAALRHAIAEEHGLHAYGLVVVTPRTVPKTTSGKIQRAPCRDALSKGALDIVAQDFAGSVEDAVPDDGAPLRERLLSAAHVSRIGFLEDYLRRGLGHALGLPASTIPPDASFLDLGLDSLKAMELAGDIQRDTGVPVEVKEIFLHSTPGALAAYLSNALSAGVEAAPAGTTEYEEGEL